jgi:hypothetical protein
MVLAPIREPVIPASAERMGIGNGGVNRHPLMLR